MEKESLKIGVLGLGLIGGSILKALHSLDKYYLIAVSKSSYKEAEAFSDISSNDKKILSACDVVFVCSKMSETPSVLSELEEILSEKTIVADVCSLKSFLNRDYKFNFIPTHPMAGTEFFGFENSFKELFQGAKWVIGKENKILEKLIFEMGAKPLHINPVEHDKMAAEISHLPMLLAYALFDCVDEKSKIIASSGFRDTTRLAMTNSSMAYDMLNINKENILLAYENFLNSFERLKNLNEEEFKKTVETIAEKRREMYDENGKNKLC